MYILNRCERRLQVLAPGTGVPRCSSIKKAAPSSHPALPCNSSYIRVVIIMTFDQNSNTGFQPYYLTRAGCDMQVLGVLTFAFS